VSLMDNDRLINAMSVQMGNMNLMEQRKTAALPLDGKKQPLERTNTHMSEIDAFFDAEG
jgi:hypothetical protein